MQRLEAKSIHGRTYYYLSQWGWKNGKCRRLSQKYLGKLEDRKSTRLNSSHGYISYAVFCLKKKNIRLRDSSPSLLPAVSLILAHCILSICFRYTNPVIHMCTRTPCIQYRVWSRTTAHILTS